MQAISLCVSEYVHGIDVRLFLIRKGLINNIFN